MRWLVETLWLSVVTFQKSEKKPQQHHCQKRKKKNLKFFFLRKICKLFKSVILTLCHPIRPCCPAMPYNKALINLVIYEKISERGLSCMELALRAGSVLWRPRSMIFSHITRFPILLERFRFDYEFNNDNLFRIPTSPKCYEYEFAIFGANCSRHLVLT